MSNLINDGPTEGLSLRTERRAYMDSKSSFVELEHGNVLAPAMGECCANQSAITSKREEKRREKARVPGAAYLPII